WVLSCFPRGRPRTIAKGLERRENLAAVQLRFALADAGNAEQFAQVRWPLAAEIFNGRVAEHDVRRHARALRGVAAPFLEEVDQGAMGRRAVDGPAWRWAEAQRQAWRPAPPAPP